MRRDLTPDTILARGAPLARGAIGGRSPSNAARSAPGSADSARPFLANRTTEERRLIAHIKRLLERHLADPHFRLLLGNRQVRRGALAACGIAIDPDEVLPLLQDDDAARQTSGQEDLPLVRLWQAYRSDLEGLRDTFLKVGECPEANPRFDAIACVSGFLTNMVERTVRLVSPTRPGDHWPLGYRVYGERSFATASDFRRAVEDL